MAPARVTNYDVVTGAKGGRDAIELGESIAACLIKKGYCIVNLNVKRDVIKSASDEIKMLEAQERFQPPAALLADGLLGADGSAEVCEVGDKDGTSLKALDSMSSELFDIIQPFADPTLMGFSLQSRSGATLHNPSEQDKEPPELSDMDCQKWLARFAKHRVMTILTIGPYGGTLDLQPLIDEECPSIEIRTEPGMMVILRTDALVQKYFSAKRSIMMTAWFSMDMAVGGARQLGDGLGGGETETPVIKELTAHAVERMKELKIAQVVTEDGVDCDPRVPPSWRSLMNHAYSSSPHATVRGICCKYPGTWGDPAPFWRSGAAGCDHVIEVPFIRWDHTNFYEPDPGLAVRTWKTCSNHGSFIDGADLFDNKPFGLSPAESKGMDPNQRHILELFYETLTASGFTKKQMMRSLVGVYVGTSVSSPEASQMERGDGGGSSTTGGAASITANRISYCLGLQGPSYTIDCFTASGLSAVYQGCNSIRYQTEHFKPNHTAICGGSYLILAPRMMTLQTAAGMLSPQGRCFAFNSTADGINKSDGVGSVVMDKGHTVVDGVEVVDESKPVIGMIGAGAMNHTGRGASIGAPSGPQEQDLIRQCLRQVGISPADVTAVECWGECTILADAVEAKSLHHALRAEDPDVSLMCTVSSKTMVGTMMETAGLGSLHKVLLTQNHGVCTPINHMHELNSHIDVENGEPTCFPTEVVGFTKPSSFHGINCRGLGGVQVHLIPFGLVDPKNVQFRRRFKRDDIAFWPAGGGELEDDARPSSGYWIIGSWSKWMTAEKMQLEDDDGLFSFTVTVGDNLREYFQIQIDGNEERTLYPPTSSAGRSSPVLGPSSVAYSRGQNLCWMIDSQVFGGRGELADAVRDDMPAESNAALIPTSRGCRAGKAGDKYVVKLHVAGKWRAVDWERLDT